MEKAGYAAIITTSGAVAVAVVTHLFTLYRERRKEKHEEHVQLTRSYLNPLRFYLSEVYYRLWQIKKSIENGGGKHTALQSINNSFELLDKDDLWFNEDGTYMASTCYLTACLLYFLHILKNKSPYLRLPDHDDATLLRLILALNIAFRSNHGIYYIIQQSIGEKMASSESSGLIGYNQFCDILRNKEESAWFHRLIQMYVEWGKEKNVSRIDMILSAIYNLSNFLDTVVSGGTSLKDRLVAEGIDISDQIPKKVA